MNQEQFAPDIEQVIPFFKSLVIDQLGQSLTVSGSSMSSILKFGIKKVSLQFQEVFQRMDREIGVLDGLIGELEQQIQTTRRSRPKAKSLNVMP